MSPSGNTPYLLLLLLGSLGPLVSLAEDHEHRQHEAHEHGVATLNVALEGSALQLELESPAMNIVGFEHRPRTHEQEEVVQQAINLLKQGDRLFLTSTAADCRLVEADVDTSLAEHGHEEHEEHGELDEEAHADFDADYVFHCQHPDALESLEVRLFQQFPGTHEIAVQVLSDKGQTALELTADDNRIRF